MIPLHVVKLKDQKDLIYKLIIKQIKEIKKIKLYFMMLVKWLKLIQFPFKIR